MKSAVIIPGIPYAKSATIIGSVSFFSHAFSLINTRKSRMKDGTSPPSSILFFFVFALEEKKLPRLTITAEILPKYPIIIKSPRYSFGNTR